MFYVLSRAWDKEKTLSPHEEPNLVPSNSVLRRVSYEFRSRARSPWSLCGSVVEHRSAESEDVRFDSSWGLGIFSLSHTRHKAKNIFLCFFTELKTYHLSYFHLQILYRVYQNSFKTCLKLW